MAEKAIPLEQYDFSGGVNLCDDAAHIGKHQLADMRNFTIDETGILVKRPGMAGLSGSISGVGKALYRLKLGGTFYLLAYIGGTLYYINETTGAATPIEASLTGSNMGFAPFQGRLYYASDSTIRFWDGVTVTPYTGQDGLTHLCVHNDRLWAAEDNGSTLYYSEIQGVNKYIENDLHPEEGGGDTEPLPGETNLAQLNADNSIPIADRSGQTIQGMVSNDGALLILMSNSLYYLYGYSSEEFTVKQEINGVGCIAPRSIASGDGMVFFLAADGVYWVRGRQIQNISEPIEPLIKALTLTERATAAGFVHDHKYHITIPAATGDSDNTLLCVFDIQTSQRRGAPVWTIHTKAGKITTVCGLEGDNGKLYTMRSESSGTAAKVYQIMQPQYTYDGGLTTIPAYAESRWLLEGQAGMWYEFRELFVSADFPEDGSMTVTWTTKQGDTEKTGNITMTSNGRVSLPISAQGTDIKIKFSIDDGSRWKLRGYTVSAHPRRVNR